VRAFFRALFGLVLRVFFRRIEVSGLEHVAAQGPVMFVLNHPNGLIDPSFLLCLAPRRVSLLAKAPLFRMPVIGSFCRAFDAIPVHRRQDEGFDPAQNRETFETARKVLAREGAIAIFPEGASHSDPKLRPLRTGAARIALGAAAVLAGPTPLRIVPAGLYYRAKRTFRSAALLHFAAPFPVEPVRLAPGEEPPPGPVRELTARIERALVEVTLQAEQTEVHALVERAHGSSRSRTNRRRRRPRCAMSSSCGAGSSRGIMSPGFNGPSGSRPWRRGSTATKPPSRRPASSTRGSSRPVASRSVV